MKVLIVYCHPRKESLNHAILKTSVEVFEKNGHKVNVRDLYAMNFNPVLGGDDAIHIENNKFVRTNEEFPDDIKIEMNHILDADLLMYIYPIWWNGFPAMLKGYVDRVFQHGFAYRLKVINHVKTLQEKKLCLFILQDSPKIVQKQNC